MSKSESTVPVRVIEETSAYWRVLFDYPPFNIVDATIFEGLQELLARMDASPSLCVVVFESANPDFYLAHFDLTGKIGNIMTAVGASGLPILMDTFVRLTRSEEHTSELQSHSDLVCRLLLEKKKKKKKKHNKIR